MSKHIRHILRRGQRGFTLIELVAVMAILAILVAIVAPAAINSERASITAQAQADSQSVRNAATDYFTRHDESEVRIPHSVTTITEAGDTAGGGAIATNKQQEVSTRWPEMYITEGSSGVPNLATLAGRTESAKYEAIFQTTNASLVVHRVTLKKTSTANVSANDLMTDYTAIDLTKLDTDNLLKQMPEGVDQTSTTVTGHTGAPNFLWLFKKVDSSLGGSGAKDDRAVVVFTLVKVQQIEGSGATARTTVDLTYQQIVGPTN